MTSYYPFSAFLAFALLMSGACTSERDSEGGLARDAQAAVVFACGDLTCSIADEYCYRAFPAAVQPGTKGYTESCRPLPLPDCDEVRRSGKCIGDPDTGMTIEVYFP